MTACDWMPGEIQSYVIPESDGAFHWHTRVAPDRPPPSFAMGSEPAWQLAHLKITGREDLVCFSAHCTG